MKTLLSSPAGLPAAPIAPLPAPRPAPPTAKHIIRTIAGLLEAADNFLSPGDWRVVHDWLLTEAHERAVREHNFTADCLAAAMQRAVDRLRPEARREGFPARAAVRRQQPVSTHAAV